MNITVFEAAKRLLNCKMSSNTNYKLMKEYFFVDYNLMDSFIFENYLNRANNSKDLLE